MGLLQHGDLVLDFSQGVIFVDVGRELSKEERLDVLKEIFDKLVFKQKIKYSIEKFILKDIQYSETQNTKTVIEELLSYDEKNFNLNNDSEQVIREVKKSVNTIMDGLKNGCDVIVLQDVFCMDGIANEYERILTDYLEDHGIRGKLDLDIEKLTNNTPYFNYFLYLRKYVFKKI